MDHGHTKGVVLISCNKIFLALDTAQALLDHVYKRFGLPDKMVSDCGPQFAAELITELLKLLGIQLSLSMAYHPQSNRTTERYNQEIEAYLCHIPFQYLTQYQQIDSSAEEL